MNIISSPYGFKKSIMKKKDSQIIKFYGGDNPELFEIERRCMDRAGKVVAYLDSKLPSSGKVLDVGAGNGFTAEKLSRDSRRVVAMEPDEKMIDPSKDIIWVKGAAQEMPFHANVFDAAYSTWAFFFPSFNKERTHVGLNELNKVVKKGGAILIVDNVDDDEFSALAEKDIGSMKADLEFWTSVNFKSTIIESHFKVDSIEEAQKLLGFYFGEKGYQINKTEIEYKLLFTKEYLTESKLWVDLMEVNAETSFQNLYFWNYIF